MFWMILVKVSKMHEFVFIIDDYDNGQCEMRFYFFFYLYEMHKIDKLSFLKVW